jgi:hypothetical protein
MLASFKPDTITELKCGCHLCHASMVSAQLDICPMQSTTSFDPPQLTLVSSFELYPLVWHIFSVISVFKDCSKTEKTPEVDADVDNGGKQGPNALKPCIHSLPLCRRGSANWRVFSLIPIWSGSSHACAWCRHGGFGESRRAIELLSGRSRRIAEVWW